MKNKLVLVLLVLALFIAGCHTSSEPPMQNLFRLNFEEGKKYQYQMGWELDQVIMGFTTKISLSSVYDIAVAENNGHDKILTAVYRNFKLNMKMKGLEVNVDTEKPLPPVDTVEQMGFLKRAFHGMIGKTFKMKINRAGELEWVKGLDEIVESMVDSIGLDERSRKLASIALKQQFSNEVVRDQFLQVFAVFPNKAIKVGDTWDKSYELLGNMPSNYISTYTVKKIDGDRVTLDVKSHINSDIGLGIKGEQTGTVVADSRWGLVIDADFQQDMELKNNEMFMQIKGTGKIRGKAIEE